MFNSLSGIAASAVAGWYLFIVLFFPSFFTFISLIFYIYYSDNLIFFVLNNFYTRSLYLYLRIILAFLIKKAIFMVGMLSKF